MGIIQKESNLPRYNPKIKKEYKQYKKEESGVYWLAVVLMVLGAGLVVSGIIWLLI